MQLKVWIGRVVLLAAGGGCVWYGLQLLGTAPASLLLSESHAVSHQVKHHTASKLAEGSGIVTTLMSWFGWASVLVGGAFFLLAVFPWELLQRRSETEAE